MVKRNAILLTAVVSLGFASCQSEDMEDGFAPDASAKTKSSLDLLDALPSPWLRADVGYVHEVGTADYDPITHAITIENRSSDIEAKYDEFNFAYQSINGDTEIVALLSHLDPTNPFTKAGLMIRSSADNASAANAFIALTPSYGLAYQVRPQNGAGTMIYNVRNVCANTWIKLRRRGYTVSAYYSTDKQNWVQIGESWLVDLPGAACVGLAITSHDRNRKAKAVFKDVSISQLANLGWVQRSIGPLNPFGSFDYNPVTAQYEMAGAGSDIEGRFDSFNYAYKQHTGNFTMVAQVTSLNLVNVWAKAGLMVRATDGGESANAFVGVTPLKGVVFQYRGQTSYGTFSRVISGIKVPVWLKLERVDNTISAYYSMDNVSWTIIGTPAAIALQPNVMVGMAVTSHDKGKVARATFKDVSVN